MSKKPIINYTSRDFESIKKDLVEHAKRYYPTRYNDFSHASFGSYMTDAVAYVGDMLSFYLDYQVNETFLETALEFDNIRKQSEQMGYKFQGSPSSYGIISIFCLISAASTGLGPDARFIPILKEGSLFKSSNGNTFMLTQDVNFNSAKTEYVAARFSEATGKPTHYALRSYGLVKSGGRFRKEIGIGEMEKFLKVRLGPAGINEVTKVTDQDGNEYYQVDYLSQDTVYKSIRNYNYAVDGVPSILKPFPAARRFVVEQDETGTHLRFGYRSDENTTAIDVSSPKSVVMQFTGKNYFTDRAFDPHKLLNTDKFGIAPSNTVLTIDYISNTAQNPNVPAGQLNTVSSLRLDFMDPDLVNGATYGEIIGTFEVNNEEAIIVGNPLPSPEEMKYRAYASYAAQNRAVTKNDYEAYCYQMPPKFGAVKRACVYNDPSNTNKRLALYVISMNQSQHLVKTNDTIKSNLKVWLQKNKMVSDGIDVYDAKIINFGFDFEVVLDATFDKITLMNKIHNKLGEMFEEKFYIGEALLITKIYNAINKIQGVIDCVKVQIKLKSGPGYSGIPITLLDILSKDGKRLQTPKNVILEIKDFDNDIRGVAV